MFPVEAFRNTLRKAVATFERHAIRFHLTGGITSAVASRADAAASKLVWVSKGSHKSRRDLRHIYRTGTDEERELVRDLAAQLGLESLLDEVLSESDEIRD